MKARKTTFEERDRYEQGILTVGEGSVQLTFSLTSFDQLLFKLKYYLLFFTKEAVLIRRLTVLSLPLKLVFPGTSNLVIQTCLAQLLLGFSPEEVRHIKMLRIGLKKAFYSNS